MVRLSMSLVPGLHQSAWSLAGHSERISMSSIGRLGGFFGRSPCWKQHPTTYQILGLSRPKLAEGRFQIKGPDNPTSQLLPIMSVKGCSGVGEGRKGKGGGEGSKS